MSLLSIFLYTLLAILALIGLVTLGFALRPRRFRPHPVPSHPGQPAPLRPGLPESVRRHFLETIGEQPPEITSAVVWGRGKACIRGVWLPLRFKTWYRPGESFFRRVEVTFFMRPVMRGTESYINGQGASQMLGKEETGPQTDHAQFLSLWAEAVLMPSVLAQSSQARWEKVDDHTALLVIPYGAGSETLTAHFDPLTGRMTDLTGARYSPNGIEKEPWRVDLLAWKEINGLYIPCEIGFASSDSGSHTTYWSVDGVAYNINVSTQLPV